MATTMSTSNAVLRIRIVLADAAQHCEWALLETGCDTVTGAGLLTDLPGHEGRVEVLLPASDVLLTQRLLPAAARRQHGTLLAYAVEDVTAGDPLSSQVSWLGADAAGINALAVADKPALLRWRSALAAADIKHFELCCETLLLPWVEESWSVAWNGTEGFVRTAAAAGGATDCGSTLAPPLSLELLLERARAEQNAPLFITLYASKPGAKPDLAAWSQALGLSVRFGGDWHWSAAATSAGPALVEQRQRWQLLRGMLPRLRPSLLMLGLALGLHALALMVDQVRLGAEQRELRAQMETRFRRLFPEAVAVVDPLLQLRRQLTTARQLGGIADSSDFLPLLAQVALATHDLPAGLLRTVSWDNGRMTLEFATVAAIDVPVLLAQLRQAGLQVETPASPADSSTLTLEIQAI